MNLLRRLQGKPALKPSALPASLEDIQFAIEEMGDHSEPLSVVLQQCEQRSQALRFITKMKEGRYSLPRITELHARAFKNGLTDNPMDPMPRIMKQGRPNAETVIGGVLPALHMPLNSVRDVLPFEGKYGLLPVGMSWFKLGLNPKALRSLPLGELMEKAGFTLGWDLKHLKLNNEEAEKATTYPSSLGVLQKEGLSWAVAAHFGATLDRFASDITADTKSTVGEVAQRAADIHWQRRSIKTASWDAIEADGTDEDSFYKAMRTLKAEATLIY